MGYISSGNTQVVAYLTQTGRSLLLKGDKTRFKVSYFTLGDSDVNYFIENLLDDGFIPDITGNENECVPSISLNIDIKNKITK